MGLLDYIKKIWRKPTKEQKEVLKQRLIAWRREPATLRIQHSSRPDRARALGYKAKQGVFLVRVRVSRGGHTRPKITKGRRSKAQSRKLNLRKNYQLIAEERVNKKYVNCEVLNSYPVAKDGKHAWYEVIMIDRASPVVKKDKDLKNINARGRPERGLTSAGRKVRGLRHKGKGVEKARPSRRSKNRTQ